jgi:hypothetical protein
MATNGIVTDNNDESFLLTFTNDKIFTVGTLVESEIIYLNHKHPWRVHLVPSQNYISVSLVYLGDLRLKTNYAFYHLNENDEYFEGFGSTARTKQKSQIFSNVNMYSQHQTTRWFNEDGLELKLSLKTLNSIAAIRFVLKFNCVERIYDALQPLKVSDNDTLLGALTHVYSEMNGSDIEFIVDAEQIAAHKFVLCMRSAVFKNMFKNDMLESTSNRIIMSDFSSNIVRAFVEYLYTDHVDQKYLAINVVEILKIACKYSVTGLEVCCTEYILQHMDESNVLDILVFADTHSIMYLKNAALIFVYQIKIDFSSLQDVHNILYSELKSEVDSNKIV